LITAQPDADNSKEADDQKRFFCLFAFRVSLAALFDSRRTDVAEQAVYWVYFSQYRII
jgi:hypothetical protein